MYAFTNGPLQIFLAKLENLLNDVKNLTKMNLKRVNLANFPNLLLNPKIAKMVVENRQRSYSRSNRMRLRSSLVSLLELKRPDMSNETNRRSY